ncbi:MAG: type II toxin-antitoxin system RelE/ParE family toxin [Candidatus Binatia bacterium]
MTVIWSPLAVARVAEAADYIARDKAVAAARWAQGVFDTVGRLAEFPRSGTVVPELGRQDVRELFHGEYRIIYRVETERVLILTVRHGRRVLDPAELDEVE